MTTAVASAGLERLYPLGELSKMGYGSRRTNLNRINSGEIPAVRVGNTYKIRESDLPRLAEPAGAAATPEPETAVDVDALAALAAKVVSSWPRLSEERRAELGRLLATT
ncbi:excisionase family DNA binding protein [Propionibacteriaceae bacterium ES.041]|nr:excisionase family DNA binding protein [Propionibacteriaceae bacterium ES.041]